MKKQFTLLSLLFACSLSMNAQKFSLVPFSSGYLNPVGIENCGDNRLFIIEQEGKIIICDSMGTRLAQPFLDISDKVIFHGERGLLGLAFDPAYAVNGYFYVNYINKSGNTQISRFRVRSDNPNIAIKSSEKFILEVDQPFANHNGGCTHFGPDGYLYIGMGDGGSGGDPNNNAQNPMSLLGKMLRIDVHHGNPYKTPANNPFVDSPGYRPEIWAMGLRNPWRWSFDAADGSMYIGEVGQNSWEEIDRQLPGAGGNNYGWRCYEGKHTYNTDSCLPRASYDLPILEYSHSDSTGDCSIIGGYVYRGTKYPSLYGRYIFTDYCSGIFRLLHIEDGIAKVRRVFTGDNSAYSSFGEDIDYELYVCNKQNGSIYQLKYGTPQQTTPPPNQNPDLNKFTFFPNPSKGNLTISYTSSKIQQAEIRVTDILGNQFYFDVKTLNSGVNTWNINLPVPKGNYYLSISTNTGKPIMQKLRIE
jgi:glucose/arabinose dehydrogenase